MPLRRAVRGTFNYVDRLATWGRILRAMRGEHAADRRTLLRSAAAAPLTAWGGFYRWRNPVLLNDVEVVVPELGQFRAHARSDELYLMLPHREAAVYAAVRALLRPGDRVIDAGANIGVFSVFAGRLVGPAGKVVAVEMMPRTLGRLRENLTRNHLAATVVEAALASRRGDHVVAALDPSLGGQATLALAHTLPAPQQVTVLTRTLDDVVDETLPGNDDIALLKMDIEGAELDALAGAPRTLSRLRAIVFEQLDDDGAIAAAIAAHGFVVEQLDRHNYMARRPIV